MECPACHTAVDGSQRFCPKCGALLPPETEASADPLVGTVLAGRYRIVKLLGEGGMGAVYLAEQQMGTTVRKVALKTLHKQLSQDPQIKARFQRECGTIAGLEHPNTIQVFDYGTTEDGLLYIVMELVQGRSLADWLEKDGAMAPARVEKIMKQVCGSLDEAHGHGIVHRDLKPDNIMLCERAGQKDWVEVLDFGIAKRSSEQDKNEQKLTQQGMVLGTPPYMSPEQFTGQPVEAASDIYALGIITYEMLTGKLPFEGNTPWEWATQHMTAQPKPIEATPMGGSIPAKMRAAIAKALAKTPSERFSSAKEFIEAFTAAGAEAAPASAPQPQHTAQLAAGSGHGPEAAAASGPSSAGGGGGGGGFKTEIGTPLAGGPGFGSAPAGFGPQAPAPGVPPASAMQAQIPAAPANVAPSGGGGRGALIGAIAVIGLLSVGAIVFALARGSHKKDVPIVSTTAADTASAVTLVDVDAGSASNDPPPPDTDTAPLGPGSAKVVVQGGGSVAPKKDAGATKPPASIPTPQIVPPPPPAHPPGPEPAECAKARAAKASNVPAAYNRFAEICASKGWPRP